MNRRELIKSLQWFHALEVNQVALYGVQARMAREEADRRLLERVGDIEAGHVRNLSEKLKELGGRPSLLSAISPTTGAVLGAITGLSLAAVLRANIIIENKAMADYKRLIDRCSREDVVDLLWSNYLDESLHTEWFKARIAGDVDKVIPGD